MSELIPVAADVSRRCLRRGRNAPTYASGYKALALLLSCFCSSAGWSAPAAETNRASAVSATPTTNAAGSFRLKPGLRVELVAAEPLVTAPVAIAFDENGRLFVAEARLSGSGTNAPGGRVRVLEDGDGTGDYTASTVYADKLPWVSALSCYSGGVFVAAGPEVRYLKDSRTNGIADLRKVVFGIESGTNTAHTQVLPNNFNWGLDNRIHAASPGSTEDVVFSHTGNGGAVPLDRAFSFDPRELTLASDGITAQTGLTFDNSGRLLVSDLAQPLRLPLFPSPYRDRDPFLPLPPQAADVLSPATPLYQPATAAAPPAGQRPAPAPRTAGALAVTWLTNAQGCTVYRGNALPTNYFGNVFIPDPAAHVIHRALLRETGLQLTAARAADEARSEFLTSANSSFRPVQMVNAPDGALYFVDAGDPSGRGRIYRVVPEGFKAPKPPRLGKFSTPDLVATLSHPNGWHRDTAARLLYERRDPAAAEPLGNLLYRSRLPLARLHALHALDGLGPLSQLNLITALRDTDERVREHAVRLATKAAVRGTLPDAAWNQLRQLTRDSSPRVRYQLALTLGELRQPGSMQALADLLWQTPDNPLIEAAVFSSLGQRAGEAFGRLAGDAGFRSSGAGQRLLRRMATMIGVRAAPGEVGQVLGFLVQAPLEWQQALPLLTGVGQGLHNAGGSLAQMDPQSLLNRFYSDAANLLLGSTTVEAWRVSGIELLSVSPSSFSDTGDLLLLPIGSGQPESVQAAAIATLGSYSDPRVAPALLRRWGTLTPPLRDGVVAALLHRAERYTAVLDALANGDINRSDLPPGWANVLRTDTDAATADRALQLLGPVVIERPAVVQRYRPTLALRGNAALGRDVFAARCASCHQPPGLTRGIGPALASTRIRGRASTLTAILEPNRSLRPGYETCVIETSGGEILWGIALDGNDTTVTLQPISGSPIVLRRSNIVYLQPRTWSLMPDGLEQDLALQQMADLLEYLVPGSR